MRIIYLFVYLPSIANSWQGHQNRFAIRSSIDPTSCGIFVCRPLHCLNVNLLLTLVAVGLLNFIDPICRSFLHGFAHVSKVGFVHPTFSLRDINVTLGLLPSRGYVIWRYSVSVWVQYNVRALKQSEWVFYSRTSLFVAPYWRATKVAKQLSTATTPLCFWFFRCRVVLMSCKVFSSQQRMALGP